VERADDLIDRLLADPPGVHLMVAGDETHLGVWQTERECYQLLAAGAGPGTRTLETGSGISTVLFAALGTQHCCITPLGEEVDRLLDYCRSRDIDTAEVRFEIGPSEAVLPRLADAGTPLDVVFIDGNHGFPTPAIDVFYGAGQLVEGGLLVLDDVHLPAVAELRRFLDLDPRFANGPCTPKWASYRRAGSGSLVQDWWEQPFWKGRPAPLPRRVLGRLKADARRVAGRLRPR
jgi:hypothetical protein